MPPGLQPSPGAFSPPQPPPGAPPTPTPTPACRVIYLEDNDIVHMKGGEYTVFNWSDVDSPSVEVRRTIQTLTMEVSQIMKVGPGAAWAATRSDLRGRGACLPSCLPPATNPPVLGSWLHPLVCPHPPAGRLHPLHGEGDL